MILGFAHITKNVAYQRGLRAVANAPAKWPLMARQATMHWLELLPHQSGPMEEIVEYDTGVVDQPGRLDVGDAYLLLAARRVNAETEFFTDGLGFYEREAGLIELAGPMHRWRVGIVINKAENAPLDPPLDIAGYAALAFYSSGVEADRDRAIAAGGRTPTEPFFVTLERKMKIIMLRSPEGTIIELIEVQP